MTDKPGGVRITLICTPPVNYTEFSLLCVKSEFEILFVCHPEERSDEGSAFDKGKQILHFVQDDTVTVQDDTRNAQDDTHLEVR